MLVEARAISPPPACAVALGALSLMACTPDPPSTDEVTSGLPTPPGDSSASSSSAWTASTTGSIDDGTSTSTSTTSTSSTTEGDGDEAPLFDLGIPDSPPDPLSCPVQAPLISAVPCDPLDITLVPPFDLDYDCVEFPDVPNVPSSYGGFTFQYDDPDVLLIGGAANTTSGELFSIRVTRDADCHITGFAEALAQVWAEADYNDGGVDYGPDDVLFLARWPVNEMGQILPGSVVTDRVIALAPLGVGASSVAGLTFVPPTYPGEGQLKVVTWSGGEWFTLPYMPAGDGTFDLGPAVAGPVLGGGPEGIVYVSGDNEGFDAVSVLVSEWSAGNVATYEVDAAGEPIVATRRDFIVGLTGAEGAHIDQRSGDFLFSTFGGGDRLVVISGFVPNPPPEG